MLWLERHGLPPWLSPTYAVMVAVAGLLGAAAVFWLVRRDRGDVAVEGRALLAGYVAALLGGHVFEALRAAPEALARGSWGPMLHAGRAAYGGLIAGVVVAVLVLLRHGAAVRPFLDRLVPGLGITYACVRTGCFLAGCDYGRVTAGALGVRFPAGSPAADDHAAAGWVPLGAPSLPVHATQLYEAALGALASAIAALWLARGYRDGRAFGTWLALYAAGRFLIELLRGDAGRGVYGGLSTAQLVSLALLLGLAAAALRARHGRRASAAAPALAALASLGLAAGGAAAQAPPRAPPPRRPPRRRAQRLLLRRGRLPRPPRLRRRRQDPRRPTTPTRRLRPAGTRRPTPTRPRPAGTRRPTPTRRPQRAALPRPTPTRHLRPADTRRPTPTRRLRPADTRRPILPRLRPPLSRPPRPPHSRRGARRTRLRSLRPRSPAGPPKARPPRRRPTRAGWPSRSGSPVTSPRAGSRSRTGPRSTSAPSRASA
ncbi:prolipoprotein diacylglyceryl transferase [Sorangium sp. So ce1097]|uniref:prolipoprotein diacylglyceryl transferase n=1 Tax=Sorangium sp. So ce1097 TaxID=3133330 RepID=UPI003F6096A7